MSENLFCPGQRNITPQYKDGYFRTFRTPPSLDTGVYNMIHNWVEQGEYDKVYIFYVHKLDLDPEYAAFLTRETINGGYRG